jgi:hypothetical protein
VKEAGGLARELTELAEREHVPLYYLALARSAAGEEVAALDLLEAAFEQRSTVLPWIGCDCFWDQSLRRHPRFVRLLERLDLPQSLQLA